MTRKFVSLDLPHWRRQWKFLLMALAALITILVPALLGQLHAVRAAPATSQAYNWKNVVTGGGGGFVDDIIFNQKQKDLIYARTDIGGAYRWYASTSTWTELLDWVSPDQWNTTGVESLA